MKLNIYNNNICLFITLNLHFLIYIFIINFLLLFYKMSYINNFYGIFLIYINYNNYIILNNEYVEKKNNYNIYIEVSTFITWFTTLFGFYNNYFLIISTFLIASNIINYIN